MPYLTKEQVEAINGVLKSVAIVDKYTSVCQCEFCKAVREWKRAGYPKVPEPGVR